MAQHKEAGGLPIVLLYISPTSKHIRIFYNIYLPYLNIMTQLALIQSDGSVLH